MPASIAYPTTDGAILKIERTRQGDWQLLVDRASGFFELLCTCATYEQAVKRLMWAVDVDLERKKRRARTLRNL